MTFMRPLQTPGRIQHVSFSVVINHHPFGSDLHAFCARNADVFLDHGFMDGGCLAFAKALKIWIPSRNKIKIVGRKGICDHAVLEAIAPEGMPLYLDGDGLATKADLIEKMRSLESCPDPVIEPLPTNTGEMIDYMETGIPFQIVRRLRKEFGDWEQNRISLKWVE